MGCGEQWSRNVRPPGRNPFLVENGLHLRYADKLRMDLPSLLLHTHVKRLDLGAEAFILFRETFKLSSGRSAVGDARHHAVGGVRHKRRIIPGRFNRKLNGSLRFRTKLPRKVRCGELQLL